MRDCTSEILLKTFWIFWGVCMKVAEILFYKRIFPLLFFLLGEKSASFQMGSSSSTLDLNVVGASAFNTLSSPGCSVLSFRLSNCVSAQDFCVPLLSTALRIWLPVGQVSVCPTRTLQITCPRAESVPSPVESVNLLYSCLCGGCCGPPSCPGHPGQQPDADRNWSWELLFQDNCCSVLSNMCFVSSLIKMECLYWLIAWISDWDLNGSKSWPHFSLVLWP